MQEKLIFPGEAGSGVVTPRAGSSGIVQKQRVVTTASSTSKAKAGSKLAGTLDAYLRAREALTPSHSAYSKQVRSSSTKGKAALTFAPASQRSKGKEKLVHVILDKSQVMPEVTNTSPGPQEQQPRRHFEDATTTRTWLPEAELDLLSNKSHYFTPSEDAISQATLPHLVPFDPSIHQLPPMPIPISQTEKNTIFGFGVLPPPKTQETEKGKKRKRAVVESSSPIKELAGPSSPAFSAKETLSSDPIETEVHVLAQETEVVYSATGTAESSAKATKVPGHGDRIAWGTQDESEYRRLNRTESERLIDEQLVVRRGPREAFPATQERTDYMDRYRSESYSPVQYTATETQMNEFRRRIGLSPVKRKPPTPKQPKINTVLPAMDLDDDEATEISEVPSQRSPMRESFDESATQQSTFTSSPPPGLDQAQRNKADDSGFGESSPRSEEVQLKSETAYCEPASPSPGKRPLLDSGLKRGLQGLTFEPKEEGSPGNSGGRSSYVAEECSSSDEESDFDESTILPRPRERRILALATQETQDFETQFISMQETQLILCSQEESSELDMEFAQESQPRELENVRITTGAMTTKGPAKTTTSVSQQINAAWFPQVLASTTASASSKSNAQDQSMLTDFFAKKPNGPAERAAAVEAERQKEFANAVIKQRRERRKGSKLEPSLKVLFEGEEEDIEVDADERAITAAVESGNVAEIAEIEDSDTEEDHWVELESQSKNVRRLPCEGWVLGQKRHKTPTPVKQYRYRQV